MAIMRSRQFVAFYFAATLSAISLIALVFASGSTRLGPVLIPFLSFFPMNFWFACAAMREAQDKVESLETRIRELEGARATS